MGTISAIEKRADITRIKITAPLTAKEVKLGDSVAVSGPCLTVVHCGKTDFSVEATRLTVERSSIGFWERGCLVNLELALKIDSRLGGHIVQGHVDGIGKIVRVRWEQNSAVISIESNKEILDLIAPRGSVTIDGVSLTVYEKKSNYFSVMLIPHTIENTTLGNLRPGIQVNIETDIIIRWLSDRLQSGSINDGSKWTDSLADFHLEE